MKCSSCGTENENGFKFCVKCGSSLDSSKELSYEQVDRGNYHSEEEFDGDRGGYTMSSGTFTIRDVVPRSDDNDLYTSDELNRSEEEFDFSMYEEPTIPPTPPQPVQPNFGQNMPVNPAMGQQPMMYQPPIMGYDPSGKPIYGQPMMYQPQIMGYDPSGKPIYGQPMMYQPQIMGYDPSGKPIYGQPVMYQPPIMGYDPSGMPIYGQPQQNMPQTMAPNVPTMANMANMPQNMGVSPTQPTAPPPEKAQETAQTERSQEKEESDFWAFFGESDRKERRDISDEEAFFGKSHQEPENDDPFADLDRRHKETQAAKRIDYMSDTPIVDGEKLKKNIPDKINKLYMRPATGQSKDLVVGRGKHTTAAMAETKEVDADKLASALNVRSRISMQISDTADADELEAYRPKKRKEYMAQADRAVEAMPKRKNPYESELDKIELPEYMKARRTKKEETAEIPSLPKTGND